MQNHRSLKLNLGFGCHCRNSAEKGCLLSRFHFTAVATFWVMSLVGIYPGKASTIAGAKSDTINISRGVPQGSVLGSLFFNIFLNDLFYFVSVAELTNYADDNQISFCHQDPVEVQSVLINELDTASKWFKDCGMTLNLNK